MDREARSENTDTSIKKNHEELDKKNNIWEPRATHRQYFIISALLFLIGALALYLLTGYMVFKISEMGPVIEVPGSHVFGDGPLPSGEVSQRDLYNFFGRILSFALAPIVSLFAAFICSFVGMRLLRSSGVVTTQVISPQDYAILGPAIAAGNEQSITQFIRLSSLSGVTGTFTKIGLTGLPLATIALTLLLGIAGIANAQFFDLAKLTLGAFLGSFVQRQSDISSRRPPER